MKDADDFTFLYEQLKYFKDHECSMKGINTLSYAVREQNKDIEGEI